MERKASAVWQGGLKNGVGKITTNSGALKEAPYSFGTRFENQGGTNPEELIAGAHAACFSMALSAQLEASGFTPEKVSTVGTISIEKLEEGWTVTAIHLETNAVVPGLGKGAFDQIADDAKRNCPISRLLKAPITLSARLNSEEKKAG